MNYKILEHLKYLTIIHTYFFCILKTHILIKIYLPLYSIAFFISQGHRIGLIFFVLPYTLISGSCKPY